MTNNEAKRKVRGYLTDMLPSDCSDEIDEIMKALEQQLCEDCISRAYIRPIIEELESDQIDNDYVLSLLSDIKNAPSVTPQRPKGKWIECGGDEPWLKGYCCSLCNFTTTQKYDYCTCGAEMGGADETN